MRTRLPNRKVFAVNGFEFVFRNALGHDFDLRDLDLNDRAVAVGCIAVHGTFVATIQSVAVFLGCDHCLVGFDPCFAVHREWIRVRVRRDWGRVNRQCLIFVFKIKILLQVALIYRMERWAISTVFANLKVPPPFLNWVQGAVVHQIIQLSQSRREARHIHRGPAERLFLKYTFEIPRAGFHATSAHRTTRCRDTVGRTFLAVGFPNLISVEHQFRACSDRTRRTFARTFVAAFAECLQAKIDRLVVGHR